MYLSLQAKIVVDIEPIFFSKSAFYILILEITKSFYTISEMETTSYTEKTFSSTEITRQFPDIRFKVLFKSIPIA